MGKPVHCCPKHQFPLDRKGEQCPICREEMEDEYGEPEPDTCHECGELAVGFDHDTSAMLCAKCYRKKP